MLKFFGIALLCISIFPTHAFAELWIIKNPKQTANLESLRSLNSHSHLSLENEYLILDFNERVTSQILIEAFKAEAAFRDLEITMDKPADPPEIEHEKGWHVDFLKYSELNPKYQGQGVIVAVLDYGVDYKHEALKNNMWKNRKEIPDNQIDDDKNGLIDDYHGYNFMENNSVMDDPYGHATHIAGIIMAQKDPDSPAMGVAPKATVMTLQIFGTNYAGQLSGTAKAIKYAVDNGAKILSNSWRIYYTQHQLFPQEGEKFIDEAISYAEKRNVIFVGTAGNEKRNLDVTMLENPMIPLTLNHHKNMITVSSLSFINNEESLSKFSNYGANLIEIAAPGDDIYSTLTNNRWKMMSGTSMATPIIAGVLARRMSGVISTKRALKSLLKTSTKSTYWDQYTTHGRVDIKKYLE